MSSRKAQKSYGLKWVAVHGLESICIVIRRRDVDMALVGPFYMDLSEELVMYSLTGAVLAEIGELADELRKRSGLNIKKPFGVVSVNPVAETVEEESGQQASSAEYDERLAINFLKEKMKSDSTFTYDETIETTISAFQHLCLQELIAEEIFVCVCAKFGVAPYNLTIKKTEEHLAVINGEHRKIGEQAMVSSASTGSTSMTTTTSPEIPSTQPLTGGPSVHFISEDDDISGYAGITLIDGPGSPTETVRKYNRLHRLYIAERFWRGCTFDSVHKTCIRSGGTAYSWLDNSYGMMWVAVHGMDNSICVVNRLHDLLTLPKEDVTCALTEAIMSEIEGLPYDDEFRKRSGQSIKKPFGVVSVIPITEKSHEVTGQLASSIEYDKNKAINFLMEKMKSESAITFDETIKTAISAFQHLCLRELKAEELLVTAWEGTGLIDHLYVDEIEEHLAVINGVSGSGDSTINEIEGQLS